MPEKTLQLDRIYLKPLSENDFELYKKIYSDPDLMKFIETIASEKLLVKSFYKSLKNASIGKSLIFVIVSRKNKIKLGFTSLFWNQESSNDVEIGTIIKKQHQCQNYAEEAMYLIMKKAFNSWQVRHIYGCCNINNNGVSFLTQKMGFLKIKNKFNIKRNIHEVIWKISKHQLDNNYNNPIKNKLIENSFSL